MSKEKIMKPEMDLIKKDEFYLFYEMMMQSLKTDDVKEGINKSLSMLKSFLNSGDIVLYKKNKDNIYVYKISDSQINDLTKSISCVVNKTNLLVEQKGIYKIDLNLGRLDNMLFIHTTLENEDYILSIVNINNNMNLEPFFWERVKDTMQIILKRAVSYERNTSAMTIDLLTGLDNRNSYEMRIHDLNEADNNLILGIFDMFRLKYVNDNYTHDKGDTYIKKTASILNKYWPKQKSVINDDGTETYIDTGHCVYRIGGDEFVLLTTIEDLKLSKIKASLASEEVNMIDLDVGDIVPLGLNYGIVHHSSGTLFKETFVSTDKIMQEDKKQMYKKYNLDRRH